MNFFELEGKMYLAQTTMPVQTHYTFGLCVVEFMPT